MLGIEKTIQKHTYARSILVACLCLMTLLTHCDCKNMGDPSKRTTKDDPSKVPPAPKTSGPPAPSHGKVPPAPPTSSSSVPSSAPSPSKVLPAPPTSSSSVPSSAPSPGKGLTEELIEAIKVPESFSPSSVRYIQEENCRVLQKALKSIMRGKRGTEDPVYLEGRCRFSNTAFPALLATILFHSDTRLLQALINQGADVNATTYVLELKREMPILYEAAIGGNFEGIKFLLDNGAKVKEAKEESVLLLDAILENSRLSIHHKKELVETLVQKGELDINETDEQGRTLLHKYRKLGELEILLNMPGIEKSLLQAGFPWDVTPWENVSEYVDGGIDLATRMISCMTAEGARKKLPRSPDSLVMKKDKHLTEDDLEISQIDRLKRYEGTPDYGRLKQAFLAIGITEEEILKSDIRWQANKAIRKEH